jgi:hypothetical protein
MPSEHLNLRPTNRTSIPPPVMPDPFVADERCIDMAAFAREPRGLISEDKPPKPVSHAGWTDTLFGT